MKQTIACCGLAAFLGAASASAGVATVWAVSDGEKVERDDRAHPLKARNAVWDGRGVRLAAARNEIVAFQVIVEADDAGIARALRRAARSCAGAAATETIAYAPPAADPTLYAGRPIQLFSVHYMNVTAGERTRSGPGSRGARPRRSDTDGWKPVQLVPENARAGRGRLPARGRARARPGDLDRGLRRAATSRPASTRARSPSPPTGRRRSLPVELRVFDFALPDANSLPAMVYYEPDQPELYQGRNLDPAYHRFAHRQRDRARARVRRGEGRGAAAGASTGATSRAKAGYEGPGEGVGNTIVPVSFYGPGPAFEQSARAPGSAPTRGWRSWAAAFPKALTFLYLPDEPYPAQYPEVRRLAENVRSNPGPGGKLPLFLTKRIVPEFQGLVGHLVHPAAGVRHRSRRGRARAGPPRLVLQRRPPAGADSRHRRARDRGPRRSPGPRSSTTSTSTSSGTASTGSTTARSRASGSRTCGRTRSRSTTAASPASPSRTRASSTATACCMYPGEEKLHPEEDRGHRRARSPPSSSRTSAAGSRTTST